jgi:hypothetical protein
MLRFAVLVALATIAAGCAGGGDGSGRGDAGDAAADAPVDTRSSTRPADPPGDETFDYVVRILETGDREGDGMVAPGLNLDGVVSVAGDPLGCRQADWTAPIAYGGYDGVDNQLPLILDVVREMDPDGVPNDFDAQIAEQVDAGGIVLLFRLSGVGSLVNDGLVSLALYIGAEWPGVEPPAKEMIEFEGESRLAHRGGQTWPVEAESVIDGDLGMPRTILRDAWIENGRLRTTPDSLSIRLSIRREFVIELDDAGVEAFVSADRLSNMVIAGWATKDEIFRTLTTFDPEFEMMYGDVARLVLDSIADIDADDAVSGCEGVSISLVGDAVDAVLEAPPAP